MNVLQLSLVVVQPRLLLVFGNRTWRYLADLAPALRPLASVRNFKELDDRALALTKDVQMEGLPPLVVLVVTHPSGWHIGGNQRRRRFGGLAGLDAEVNLLRTAMASAS